MLNVGDRIRIVRLPGENVPGYWLDPETRHLFQALITRRRAVRISEVEDWNGVAWFHCRFFWEDQWLYHSVGLSPADGDCWVAVRPRNVRAV